MSTRSLFRQRGNTPTAPQTVSFSTALGAPTVLDFVASRRLPGTASGTVTDAATGAPLAGVTRRTRTRPTARPLLAVEHRRRRPASRRRCPENDYTFTTRTEGDYLPQAFDGVTAGAAATVVTVEAGEARTGIDFALVVLDADFAVTFTGRVSDASGDGVPSDLTVFSDVFSVESFATAADGTFSVTSTNRDLAASLVAVRVAAPGFETEFFDDKPPLAVADLFQTGGMALTVDLGEIVLAATGEDPDGIVVSGTVSDDETGALLSGALVAALRLDAPGVRCAVTDASAFPHRRPDACRYVMLFTQSDYAPEFFPAAETSAEATVLDIDANRDGVNGLIGGLNRPVGAAGRLAAVGGSTGVRGVVRSAQGVPVAGALVTARGDDGPQAYAFSDAAGRFSLDGVGDFVSVRVDRPRYALASSAVRASTGGQLFVTLDQSAATSGEGAPERARACSR